MEKIKIIKSPISFEFEKEFNEFVENEDNVIVNQKLDTVIFDNNIYHVAYLLYYNKIQYLELMKKQEEYTKQISNPNRKTSNIYS